MCLTLRFCFCFLFTAHFINTTKIKLRSNYCGKLLILSLRTLAHTSVMSERETTNSTTNNPIANDIEISRLHICK